MQNKTNKNTRIEVRVSNDIKSLIERAAQQRGLSLSAFATSILVENAKQVIEEAKKIRLNERDQAIFLKALDKGPNKALQKAAKRYKGKNDE